MSAEKNRKKIYGNKYEAIITLTARYVACANTTTGIRITIDY